MCIRDSNQRCADNTGAINELKVKKLKELETKIDSKSDETHLKFCLLYTSIQYLERKLLESRQLIPPIPDKNLIRKMTKHYPHETRVAIITRGVVTINAVSYTHLLNRKMQRIKAIVTATIART